MNTYQYQAALLCEECAQAARTRLGASTRKPDMSNPWEWPDGPYADGGGEADTPQHCDHCGIFLENPLTEDGKGYVRDMVELQPSAESRRKSEEIAVVWRRFYGYLFP